MIIVVLKVGFTLIRMILLPSIDEKPLENGSRNTVMSVAKLKQVWPCTFVMSHASLFTMLTVCY